MITDNYTWNVYRDSDTWHLRKIVVELYRDNKLVHRTRMFWCLCCLFKRALRRRKKWMLKVAEQMK